MAYRAQQRDPAALTVIRNAAPAELPESAVRALEAVEEDGPREGFTFHRDPVQVEPLDPLLRRALSLWAGLQLPILLGLVLSLQLVGGFVLGLAWIILSGVTAALALRPVWRASERNRGRVGRGGSFGVYLLEEGMLLHQPDGTHYLPREAVHELLAVRHAPEPHARTPKPARTEVTVTYHDAEGETRGLAVSPMPFRGHDPVVARAIEGWLHGASAADVERFGDVPPRDLARPEWAAAWRRFWRLRGSAQISATVSTVFIGIWFFFAGRSPLVTLTLLLLWLTTVVLRLRYSRFRCPRCGLSPNLPLRSGGARHCLSCGLPIYTSARALPEPEVKTS